MEAISLWQPWASLWLSPNKRFETRHWPTNVRGWILVHAAKKMVRDLPRDLDEIVQDEFGCSWNQTLPTGALIGAVEIVACHRVESLTLDADSTEWACGDFGPGRFAWERAAFHRFVAGAVSYRGRQGIFNVQDYQLPFDVLLELNTQWVEHA